MKEMTLRDIQLFSLDILKDVHEFCIANGIRYSLAYGTLLGAIRHKGFIPWDDDIDIIMPRPDYERFCKTYNSKKGLFIFSPLKRNCYLNYARVCDLGQTYVHSTPWCKQSPTGLWIDIFPIDAVNQNEEREKELEFLTQLNKKRLVARFPMDNLKRDMPFKRRIATVVKKMLFFWTDVDKIVEEYERYISRFDFQSSKWCGMRSITTYYMRDNYPTSFFDMYVDVDFEGNKFKAIAQYDEYLRIIYGDYMQLPPEEKRIRHPQEMYWKK